MTTAIVGLVVLLCVLFAARKMLKDRKKSPCGCGCSGCPGAGTCGGGDKGRDE